MKYPIYILANDDLSIVVIDTSSGLSSIEKVDVENGLYSGWDCDGYPFRVLRDNKAGIKIEQTSDKPQPKEMQQAIFRYVDGCSMYYRPDEPFLYDKHTNDYIGIIVAMKEHIRKAPFKQKIVNFFRRF